MKKVLRDVNPARRPIGHRYSPTRGSAQPPLRPKAIDYLRQARRLLAICSGRRIGSTLGFGRFRKEFERL